MYRPLYTVLDDLAQLGRNRLDVSTRLADKHRVFRPHAFRVEMILIVQRGRQRLDRSISKRTLESQLSEQTMRHNNLLVAGIGKDTGRAAPGRVRDREAAALAGGGGADLRSKVGEPPILDAAWESERGGGGKEVER